MQDFQELISQQSVRFETCQMAIGKKLQNKSFFHEATIYSKMCLNEAENLT